MATRAPHTYRRRSGIYYARLYWPRALHPSLAKIGISREIRCSLRTHCPLEARRRMLDLLSFFHNTVDSLQNTVFTYSCRELTDAHKRICEYTKTKEDVEMTLSEYRPAFRQPTVPAHLMQPFLEDLTGAWNRHTSLSTASATFIPYAPKTVTPISKAIFESTHNGYRISSDAEDPELAALEIAALHRALSTGGGGSGFSGPTDQKLTLAEAKDEYYTLMCKGRWKKQATANQNKTRLDQVVDILGADRDTTSLTLKDIERFESNLLERIDINSSRRGRKKDCTTLAVSTAKALISLTKALLRFCYKRHYLSENLAEFLGDLIKEATPRKKKLNPYQHFTHDDLERIFGHFLYANEDLKSKRKVLDSFFWAPLIGLFSGMRLNEICQLKVEDIQCEQGIWFINSDDLSETQSSKNESSKRRIPIHDELIRIGLLDFWKTRKSTDGTSAMLFRELKWDVKNQWIKQTSRWFVGDSGTQGHLDLVNLSVREKKVFHSFRHTVVNRMRKLGVSTTDIAAIVGHEPGLTTEHYGGDYELETLKQIVDRLHYPLDLSHVHYEKFIDFQLADGKPNARHHIIAGKKARIQHDSAKRIAHPSKANRSK